MVYSNDGTVPGVLGVTVDELSHFAQGGLMTLKDWMEAQPASIASNLAFNSSSVSEQSINMRTSKILQLHILCSVPCKV